MTAIQVRFGLVRHGVTLHGMGKASHMWKVACVCSIVLAYTVLPADASLVTFGSRTEFNAAASHLPIETFEAGLVGPASVTACNGIQSSLIASPCFPAGGLLPGASYFAFNPFPGSPNIVVIGPDFPPLENPSKLLAANFGTLFISFTAANAAGFDVFPGRTAGDVVISVFSPSSLLLGRFTVTAPLSGAFAGVISDTDPIGQITVSGQAPSAPIDNLAFGTAVVSRPSSLVILVGGLTALYCISRRKDRR